MSTLVRVIALEEIVARERELRALTLNNWLSGMNLFLDVAVRDDFKPALLVHANVAEEDGILIAWSYVDMYYGLPHFSVYVHPARRGRGIARHLAQATFRDVAEKVSGKFISEWRSEQTTMRLG